MTKLDGGPSIFVQFADFDGTSNMIVDVPLARVPSVGEQLNVRHEDMVYFLEIEGITNFVDCDTQSDRAHTITIDGRLVSCMPGQRAGASE